MQKEKPELLARNVNAWFADLDGNYQNMDYQMLLQEQVKMLKIMIELLNLRKSDGK